METSKSKVSAQNSFCRSIKRLLMLSLLSLLGFQKALGRLHVANEI